MNTTVNGSSCSFLPNPTAEKIGRTFAYCLILVVSLVGNSFIGIIVYKTQTLRKPINYFIVNMAMSDLLFPIFLLPVWIEELYMGTEWRISGPLGQALCKLVFFLPNVSMFVSIQSLVLIAVDRYGAVVYPLRSPLISSKLCPFFILATWIAAMAVDSPFFVALKLVEHSNGKLYCTADSSDVFRLSSSFANYILATTVVFFYTPIALLVILYCAIVVELKTQKIPGEQSVDAGQRRAKRNRNVLKMAIAIVVVFVLCWVPKSIFFLLSLFAPDLRPCGFWLSFSITYFVAYSNCAINPCICFMFCGNYRQGLKRLPKCFNAAQDRVN